MKTAHTHTDLARSLSGGDSPNRPPPRDDDAMLAVVAGVWTLALAMQPSSRTFADPCHRVIELHPLCVAIVDTPEFQRLRFVSQLGQAKWVYPGAVHDRFQHSLGVSHLAQHWVRHFQRVQPELQISERDVLCVTLAGLLHDLGHGPLSHFWEGCLLPIASPGGHARHEEISCALIHRLLDRNDIDVSPWLGDGDISFVQALIRGAPPAGASAEERRGVYRVGARGVLGEDKAFLYDVVANQRNGFDVDKLDYFERDSLFAGVVKVSFDRARLMAQARVALVASDEKEANSGGGGEEEEEGGEMAAGRPAEALRICWPEKCVYEVLQCFQTRFSLHAELYQHRVTASIQLMMADALLLADAVWPIYGRDGAALRMSRCGGAEDVGLDGYVQLTDALLPILCAEATRRAAADAAAAEGGAEGERSRRRRCRRCRRLLSRTARPLRTPPRPRAGSTASPARRSSCGASSVVSSIATLAACCSRTATRRTACDRRWRTSSSR